MATLRFRKALHQKFDFAEVYFWTSRCLDMRLKWDAWDAWDACCIRLDCLTHQLHLKWCLVCAGEAPRGCPEVTGFSRIVDQTGISWEIGYQHACTCCIGIHCTARMFRRPMFQSWGLGSTPGGYSSLAWNLAGEVIKTEPVSRGQRGPSSESAGCPCKGPKKTQQPKRRLLQVLPKSTWRNIECLGMADCV